MDGGGHFDERDRDLKRSIWSDKGWQGFSVQSTTLIKI